MRLSIRVPRALKKSIERRATKEGRTIADTVISIVEQALGPCPSCGSDDQRMLGSDPKGPCQHHWHGPYRAPVLVGAVPTGWPGTQYPAHATVNLPTRVAAYPAVKNPAVGTSARWPAPRKK
jgi:hypothetical protein